MSFVLQQFAEDNWDCIRYDKLVPANEPERIDAIIDFLNETLLTM